LSTFQNYITVINAYSDNEKNQPTWIVE